MFANIQLVSVSVPSFRLVLASVLGSKISAFDSWVFGLAMCVGINFALWIDRMESSCSHLEGFRRFWFSGYWTKEFEGSELPFGELRRTSKVQNAENKESRKTNFRIFFSWILREGNFGTPKIPKMKMVFSSSGFQHGFVGLWFFRHKFQRSRTLKYSSRLIFEGPTSGNYIVRKVAQVYTS
ncbi:hypothetical protein RhiirC2_798453 [Rhizophagus irregularis]|uniref:Uncharacterized protein n=1 Tax=Rhizophagus irregularis TaxID=588596 RepID=A0A2N1M6E2_9GLOM|nr:hypothetical protein RhiirC2_798453 [Rhizophagus irregularis]